MVFLCKNGRRSDHIWEKVKEGGGKNLLKNDIEQQQEKRNKFSRRRNFYEDQNVDYINERNRKFNKKLERFFGKDCAEIKANLERGTAI